jgi:U3 small nucleolar RNA-associated protein 19
MTMAASSSTLPSSAETASQIKSLLKEIVEDRSDAARLDELRRIFARLIQAGQLELHAPKTSSSSTSTSTTKSTKSAKQKWQHFLVRSHKTMVSQLCRRIHQGKRTAVRTFWGVVATSPTKSNNGLYSLIDTELLNQWVDAMSLWPDSLQGDQSVRHAVETEFLHPYTDVQYYTMVAVARTAQQVYQKQKQQQSKRRGEAENTDTDATSTSTSTTNEQAERLMELLMMIPIADSQSDLDQRSGYLFPPPAEGVPESHVEKNSEDSDGEESSEDEEDDDDESEEEDDGPPRKKSKNDKKKTNLKNRFMFEKHQAHRRVWSKAWLAVLKLALPATALKAALRFLPEHVLPNVANPLRFADFFMAAYNHTGVVSVLALDGLFLLMTEAGLEYPDFYKQLYKLITPSLFYVKYRIKFFRLLDKCLSRNEMLPAHVVAAFVKRLVRSSLNAPVPVILFVLALTSNLLRKHPESACLVHRDGSELEDGFDAATDDPEQAGALQSSLWELGALAKHFYPAVVTLAKSVGRPEEDKAPMHNLEDFLGQTYKSLFEQERKRMQRKSKTPLTFQKPDSLFSATDVFAGILAVPGQQQ